jgi:hypothetical protein
MFLPSALRPDGLDRARRLKSARFTYQDNLRFAHGNAKREKSHQSHGRGKLDDLVVPP